MSTSRALGLLKAYLPSLAEIEAAKNRVQDTGSEAE